MTEHTCVIGYPVKHSLSPTIHNAGYKKLGIDWEYSAIEIKPDEFDEKIREIVGQGYRGANVTMPFKSNAFEISDRVNGVAKKLEAVNTLVFEDNEIIGHNTDADGFALSLVENSINVANTNVLVIGAGGASKAICSALVFRGANVFVAARDLTKAKIVSEIAKDPAGGTISAIEFDERNNALDDVELVVNATPVGMTIEGKTSREVPIDTSKLNPLHTVVDTIYYPQETQLLKEARETGCTTINGIEMLLYQAVIAFNLMTGVEAPITAMRKSLMESL